jgi:hypothetical protein
MLPHGQTFKRLTFSQCRAFVFEFCAKGDGSCQKVQRLPLRISSAAASTMGAHLCCFSPQRSSRHGNHLSERPWRQSRLDFSVFRCLLGRLRGLASTASLMVQIYPIVKRCQTMKESRLNARSRAALARLKWIRKLLRKSRPQPWHRPSLRLTKESHSRQAIGFPIPTRRRRGARVD